MAVNLAEMFNLPPDEPNRRTLQDHSREYSHRLFDDVQSYLCRVAADNEDENYHEILYGIAKHFLVHGKISEKQRAVVFRHKGKSYEPGFEIDLLCLTKRERELKAARLRDAKDMTNMAKLMVNPNSMPHIDPQTKKSTK